MKKTLQSSLILFSLLLVGCSQINYDHPLDSQVGYEKPGYFEDENGDGLANRWDPTHPFSKENLDTIPPEIKLVGEDTVRIQFKDPEGIVAKLKTQYTVSDNKQGNVTVVVNAEFSVIFADTHTIRYTATDAANLSSTVYRVVIILPEVVDDTTKPVISASPLNPEITAGSGFDPMKNVSAYDNKDGRLTEKVTYSGSFDTTKVGEYTLNYSVKDQAGNIGTLTRKLTVFSRPVNDTDFPVITLKGSSTMKIGLTEKWVDPGYTANDPTEGDLTASVKVTGEVGSGQGTYSISYSVTDKALHSKSVTRIVQRGEKVEPEMTFKNPKDSVVKIEKGAVFKIPELNIVDPDKNEKIPMDSVKYYPKFDTNLPDTYELTLVVADSDNNLGTLSIKVIVGNGGTPEDKTPPVITIKGKNPDTVTVSTTSTYKDSGATAIDAVDGVVTVTTSGAVDRKTAKKYTINYIAKDKANNADTASRIVVVVAAKPDTGSSDLLAKYNVLAAAALTTMSKSYGTATIEGDTTKAPDLSKMTEFRIDWNLPQKTINSMSISMPNPVNYLDIKAKATHTLGQTAPTIKFTGITQIPKFDGEYYVTLSGTNFVMVKKDGSFAIIMKP